VRGERTTVTGFLLRNLFEGVGLSVMQDGAALDYGCHRGDHGSSKVNRYSVDNERMEPIPDRQTKQS
jgi:hypothetical protein